MDMDAYTLLCESYHAVVPAGPRLFRTFPRPAVKFSHPSLADAETDAEKLRQYLAQTEGPKSRKH